MSTRPTRLVLLGHPVGHSLSPKLQNAALRSAGLPLAYEALDVRPEQLGEKLLALRAAGAGGNVTIPHKIPAAALCDVLTPLARRVGAVNTFWTEDGRLHGDNTDVGGIKAALQELLGVEPRLMRVAVLGTGGAAAAALAAGEQWTGCDFILWGRTRRRAEALRSRFPAVHLAPSLREAVTDVGLLVNATPVGMTGADVPVDPALLPSGAAALDLVYRRGETPWVHALRARGHPAADGLSVLLEQGALAFERWFGLAPDRVAMRRALD